ncbi:MAG TPA: hypothetical protein ENN18_04320 [Proteobacteria bacterium]|nr:hypothetical protein [Pseudomonadota bacterium]
MAKDNGGTPWPIWAVVTILVALIGAYATIKSRPPDKKAVSPSNHAEVSENTIPPSRNAPSISISEISDVKGRPVKNNAAPFKIIVKGEVLNVEGLFVYLVVKDKGKEYIQPTGESVGLGLMRHPKVNYSGNCYLGEKKDPLGVKNTYEIYAVVTDREYPEYHILRRDDRLLAVSRSITLIKTHRGDL